MTDRTRVWEAILYPESLPSNWLETLEQTRVQIAVSPLHDKDVWTESDEQENQSHIAGELKKPHYHVVMYFESLKTPNQALELLKSLGVKRVNPIPSPKTYNRYLCHLDQPNKAKYNPDDVIRLNGAVCDMSAPSPTSEQSEQIRNEVLRFIESESIVEMRELTMYALNESREQWLWYIEHHTIFLDSVLRSARYGAR